MRRSKKNDNLFPMASYNHMMMITMSRILNRRSRRTIIHFSRFALISFFASLTSGLSEDSLAGLDSWVTMYHDKYTHLGSLQLSDEELAAKPAALARAQALERLRETPS